jgi:hypothetical protein
VALVEARNVIGYNWEPSLENTSGAKLRTEPLAPLAIVTRVDAETTDTMITVAYPNFFSDQETGGSPLLSLNLWYDQGVDNWVSLIGNTPWFTLDDKFTAGLPDGLLIPGQDYKFKYRGINLFGEGAFSAISTVKAAMRPDRILTPVQQIVNRDLRVTWVAPNERGSPITVYNVYAENKAGVYVEYVACRSTSLICSIALTDLLNDY